MEESMTSGNGSDQASLDYTLKYNPPMDLAVAERNLKEAKKILDQLGIVFLLGSGVCLGATRDKAFIPWDDDVDLVAVVGINGLTEKSADIAPAAPAVQEIDGIAVAEEVGVYLPAGQVCTLSSRLDDLVSPMLGNVAPFRDGIRKSWPG